MKCPRHDVLQDERVPPGGRRRRVGSEILAPPDDAAPRANHQWTDPRQPTANEFRSRTEISRTSSAPPPKHEASWGDGRQIEQVLCASDPQMETVVFKPEFLDVMHLLHLSVSFETRPRVDIVTSLALLGCHAQAQLERAGIGTRRHAETSLGRGTRYPIAAGLPVGFVKTHRTRSEVIRAGLEFEDHCAGLGAGVP